MKHPVLSSLRSSSHHHHQEHFSWSFPTSLGSYTLHGSSRAAASTGFAIPELRLALDMGTSAHRQSPEDIFITHTHSDHVHELIYQLSRVKPPRIYAPKESIEYLENYLFAIKTMAYHHPIEKGPTYKKDFELLGVQPGDTIEMTKGSKRFYVDVVACDHSIPCVGYRFFEERKRLRPEFASRSGKELGQLRNQGVAIDERYQRPLFAYLGDTTTNVYSDESHLLEMPIIITECSFLREEHRGAAQKSKHTIWSNLQGIIEANPNTLFVLIHFSHRYQREEIVAWFEERSLANVLPWML